jgi:chromosome segregation ATPase
MVRNLLDRIPVKCIVCGQGDLRRGDFDDHIQKVCPKIVVSCSSADIKCSWTGQRDQLNQHLLDCRFQSIRPVITEFIAEYQQLKDQVNQQVTQINGQQDEIGQLKDQVNQQVTQINEQQNNIEQLKDQVNRQVTQINEQKDNIGQLKEQLRQKDTEIACTSSQLRK